VSRPTTALIFSVTVIVVVALAFAMAECWRGEVEFS